MICSVISEVLICNARYLKGLGHALFSIDQMVIELTEITKQRLKTIEELKQTQES